jgi:hypothetical protein
VDVTEGHDALLLLEVRAVIVAPDDRGREGVA